MKVSLILIKQRSDSAFRKICKWHIGKKNLTKYVGELKFFRRAKFCRIMIKKTRKLEVCLLFYGCHNLTFSNVLACQWKTR